MLPEKQRPNGESGLDLLSVTMGWGLMLLCMVQVVLPPLFPIVVVAIAIRCAFIVVGCLYQLATTIKSKVRFRKQ